MVLIEAEGKIEQSKCDMHEAHFQEPPKNVCALTHPNERLLVCFSLSGAHADSIVFNKKSSPSRGSFPRSSDGKTFVECSGIFPCRQLSYRQEHVMDESTNSEIHHVVANISACHQRLNNVSALRQRLNDDYSQSRPAQ